MGPGRLPAPAGAGALALHPARWRTGRSAAAALNPRRHWIRGGRPHLKRIRGDW